MGGRLKTGLLPCQVERSACQIFGSSLAAAAQQQSRSRGAETEKQLIRRRQTNLEAASPSGPCQSHRRLDGGSDSLQGRRRRLIHNNEAWRCR